MVNVLSMSGAPLAPTIRYGKVRHLLKDGLAVVVKRDPFTVQLKYPIESTMLNSEAQESPTEG